MVFMNKKKRWQLGTAPLNKNIEIESPPKFVPIPEKATHERWIDLKDSQCQWALNDFFDPPSSQFPCCGLPVEGGKGMGRRFCKYHAEKSRANNG